jgi:hypothetical protein
MDQNNTVSRIYNSQGEIEIAVRTLLDIGFKSENLSILLPNGSVKTVGFINRSNPVKRFSFTDDLAIGIETGALVGSAAGLLAGLGLLGISSVDGLITGRPIVLVLSGLIIGALIGSFGGALVGWSLSRNEKTNYESNLNKGLMLVVHTLSDHELEEAESILEQTEKSFAPEPTKNYKERSGFFPPTPLAH